MSETREQVIAELARLGNITLCERLRGTYRIPVNDGAGPLNGSNEFVRTFETGPIQHEAARRIEALISAMDHALVHIHAKNYDKAIEILS